MWDIFHFLPFVIDYLQNMYFFAYSGIDLFLVSVSKSVAGGRDSEAKSSSWSC